jgi:hypothetical protein
MGSFSEVVLGFSFRRDTPGHVLAAFAGLAPDLAAAQSPDHPQPLPDPVRDDDDLWMPDDFYADGDDLDGQEDEPWRHDWASMLSQSMSVAITPSAQLVWSELGRWHLSCRAGFKAPAEVVHAFLRWIGPFIGDGFDNEETREHPLLVGYVKHEYDRLPALLWCRDGKLELDRLGEEDPDRMPGTLVLVCGLPGSGKEELLQGYRDRGVRVYDEFHGQSINHDPHPLNSRFVGAAFRDLEWGGTVVVSDVRLCLEQARALLLEAFSAHVPGVRSRVISFANDPDLCRSNVITRAEHEPGHDVRFELSHIDQFSPGFTTAGEVRPVLPWGTASGA